MTPIDVSLSAAPETVEVIGALSDDLGTDWTLIGGLMVGVHLAANDRQPIRLTKDVDLLIDARAVVAPPRLEQAASTLVELGFKPEAHPNEAGETVCHRFARDTVKVDLLAPEGLQPTSRSLTTVPGARTIQAPGGTQALRRSSIVEIRSGAATAAVRIPSLLGALIAKACALPVSDHVEDQERDVAVLLTLVDDPVAMRAEIDDQGRGPRRKDLRRLRGCQPLMSRDHRGWRGIATHDQDVGRAVLQVLLNQ